MNSIVAVVFFAVVVAAHAGILAPSSLITSTYAAPALTTHSAPLAYYAPLAAPGQAAESTVVAGPSGTITNTKSITTPAIATTSDLPTIYAYKGLYV